MFLGVDVGIWLNRNYSLPISADVFRRRRMTCGWCRPLKQLRRPLESIQYVSIRYTEPLAVAGIESSVGSRRYLWQRPGRVGGRPVQEEGIGQRGRWRHLEVGIFGRVTRFG